MLTQAHGTVLQARVPLTQSDAQMRNHPMVLQNAQEHDGDAEQEDHRTEDPHALVSIPIDSPTPGPETIRSTTQLRSGHLTPHPLAETPMRGSAVSPVLWP